LCCPFDKADLNLRVVTKDEEENILEGILSCASCNRVYPIITGIPIMSPDEYRDFELERPMLEKWEKLLDENQGEVLESSSEPMKTIEGV
ncbi:MAG: Trm112 family protein, partial [Arenibacter sp.]|nr:Trm112 family protein [Arenibacter sp.]